MQGMFYGAERGDTSMLLPITCPALGCGTLLTQSDVFALATAQALSNIYASGVQKYVMESDGMYKSCCLAGCSQVIKMPTVRAAVPPTVSNIHTISY